MLRRREVAAPAQPDTMRRGVHFAPEPFAEQVADTILDRPTKGVVKQNHAALVQRTCGIAGIVEWYGCFMIAVDYRTIELRYR